MPDFDPRQMQRDRENQRRAFAGLPPRSDDPKGAVTHETTPELQHFLTLATGEYAYASSGGPEAEALAECALQHIPHLDEKALRGFVTFCGICKVQPERARELLEE